MGVADVLGAEVSAGLPRLRGGRVAVRLPLRQSVIDEVLRLAPGVPADLAIDVGDDRRVQVRYGVFHANARLHPTAVLAPTPIILLELASQLVAWGLRRAPLPPFVRIAGRQLEIHLADVPALRDVAPLWRHVEQVTFDSTPGLLDVRVAFDIV
jgi:hypothetical protein